MVIKDKILKDDISNYELGKQFNENKKKIFLFFI